LTKLVTTGNYTDRDILCWDQEETISIIHKICKKFLEEDPEIKMGSDYYLSKNPNGLSLESIKTKLHNHVDFTKSYQSSVAVTVSVSSLSMSVNLVAMQITKDTCMAIKLNLGTSRDTRLEKRITPKSVDKLDEIVKLFVEELNKQIKTRKENFIESEKQYKSNLEHSKTFPDFAEKLGFGRKDQHEYSIMWGEGNYLSITKEFSTSIWCKTNINLKQRVDGYFDIHIEKIDEEILRELIVKLIKGRLLN